MGFHMKIPVARTTNPLNIEWSSVTAMMGLNFPLFMAQRASLGTDYLSVSHGTAEKVVTPAATRMPKVPPLHVIGMFSAPFAALLSKMNAIFSFPLKAIVWVTPKPKPSSFKAFLVVFSPMSRGINLVPSGVFRSVGAHVSFSVEHDL